MDWDEDECMAYADDDDPHGGEPEWCQICDIPFCTSHIRNLMHHTHGHTLEELYEERRQRSKATAVVEAPKPAKKRHKHAYRATLVHDIGICSCGKLGQSPQVNKGVTR
jgi:hypothetical protein